MWVIFMHKECTHVTISVLHVMWSIIMDICLFFFSRINFRVDPMSVIIIDLIAQFSIIVVCNDIGVQ